MDRQDLLKRLKGYEWTDVEFKEAQREVPKSAYETVSAFSNTHCGWLVFGIRQMAAGYKVAGIADADGDLATTWQLPLVRAVAFKGSRQLRHPYP